jgi:hypothetical protein
VFEEVWAGGRGRVQEALDLRAQDRITGAGSPDKLGAEGGGEVERLVEDPGNIGPPLLQGGAHRAAR